MYLRCVYNGSVSSVCLLYSCGAHSQVGGWQVKHEEVQDVLERQQQLRLYMFVNNCIVKCSIDYVLYMFGYLPWVSEETLRFKPN